MMTREQIVESLAEDETVVFLEGPEFDVAILGLVERYGLPQRIVCYDYAKVMAVLRVGGFTEEEAEEWYSFNIIDAWWGEGTPCFLWAGDSTSADCSTWKQLTS